MPLLLYIPSATSLVERWKVTPFGSLIDAIATSAYVGGGPMVTRTALFRPAPAPVTCLLLPLFISERLMVVCVCCAYYTTPSVCLHTYLLHSPWEEVFPACHAFSCLQLIEG